MLYVDTKCSCEKWSPIHTSSKDSEIYMAWATKKYSLVHVHSIPTAFVHFFLPVWHICPVKPGEQKQENMLTPSLHVPPCRQGWLAHSSMPAFKEMKKKWQENKTNNCNGIQIMMIISTSVKRNVHFFVNTLIHGSGLKYKRHHAFSAYL